MPRYVLLRHECPAGYREGPHWDFMLEHEGALWTWSLLDLPRLWRASDEPPDAVRAVRLGDHRLAYLDYEGPLSGDRGQVTRLARGEYALSEAAPGSVTAALLTGGVGGTAHLRRIEGDRWTLDVKGPARGE